MKAKIFYNIESFNDWAKGKALTRDVIIHTLTWKREHGNDTGFAIVVYHPEDENWDKTETPHKTQIIDVPIPQTKVEEKKVST